MLYPFFALAAVSPTRQRSFRLTAVGHLLITTLVCWLVIGSNPGSFQVATLGYVLLIAGIVEGAVLIGWRLAQMPKSQAMEFLLVSALEPGRFFAAEALVGLVRLALVTLVGAPLLVMLCCYGLLEWIDLVPLLGMPFIWGALTGLGLTSWAYESARVRRWGERLFLGLLLLYLAIGVLIGEHLRTLLAVLPEEVARWLWSAFLWLHEDNPFALLTTWLTQDPSLVWAKFLTLQVGALTFTGLCFLRAAWRLKAHFHERHYQPLSTLEKANRGHIADRPLSWWAVRRVLEYSGRVNLWLAGGFGILFALYIVAGPHWPVWLGRVTFELVERTSGGVAGLATGLVLLAAVPAAYQYGLWDSHAQKRAQRLELLLLTELEGGDYWHAAATAAWRRGRGYFAVAVLLWLAAAIAGQATWWQALAAVAASMLLWALYFALGFWAFARGLQANGLGSLLVIGLPLATWGLMRLGWTEASALLPPGAVLSSGRAGDSLAWVVGAVSCGVLALWLGWSARARCTRELRHWYNLHHGNGAMC